MMTGRFFEGSEPSGAGNAGLRHRLRAGPAMLIAICLLAFLVRLLPCLLIVRSDPTRAVRSDSSEYLDGAHAILNNGTFSLNPDSPDVPQLKRTPGYPLLIASVYSLFGRDVFLFLLLQIVVSVGTVALVWWLALLLWNDVAAAAAAALFLALDSLSILHAELLLTETVFALFMTLHVLAVVQLLTTDRSVWGWGLAAGAFLAAATYVRPVSYYWILPLCMGLIWIGKQQGRKLRQAALPVLAILLAWLPPIAGWQWRNYQVSGIPQFSTIQHYNLLFYRAAGIVAARESIAFEDAQKKLEAEAPPVVRATAASWDEYCRLEGTRIVLQNPVIALRQSLMGAARLLGGPGEGGITQFLGSTVPGLTAYATLGLLLLYSGVMISMLGLLRSQRLLEAPHMVLWGFMIYLVAVSAGPEAYSRFRMPLMPILAAYAGGSVLRLRGGRFSWRLPRGHQGERSS